MSVPRLALHGVLEVGDRYREDEDIGIGQDGIGAEVIMEGAGVGGGGGEEVAVEC